MPERPGAGPDRPVRAGVRLALTTFTVLPLPVGRVDRPAARVAMVLAPVVGAALGLVLGGLAVGLHALRAPALLLGALVTAGGALATRGLHLDGLADTVDALGSYRDRPRALEIMRSPEVGPFGVVAIGLVLLIRAAALAGLAARPAPALLFATVTATATGRLAATWACRSGVPAARPDGLGALVAGTVDALVAAVATLGLAAFALLAVPDRRWQGPLAVLVALAAAGLALRHAVRRLGGISGDVLGALIELAETAAYALLALGG